MIHLDLLECFWTQGETGHCRLTVPPCKAQKSGVKYTFRVGYACQAVTSLQRNIGVECNHYIWCCRYRQTAKIGKAMAGPAAEVLANLRGKLEGFQEHLPLIKALRNPGLRDRHWDKISQSETR